MKIIFDLDDVILDSKVMKAELYRVLAERGCKDVESKYLAWRSNGKAFSYREFIVHVDGSLGLLANKEEQDRLYNQIFELSKESINKDVFKIMDKVGMKNCYILTHGTPEDQKEKIRKSIGEGVVLKEFIVTESKAETVKDICEKHKHEKVIFVDDKALHFENIPKEECKNLKTVLFDESGVEKLEAAIRAAEAEEANRNNEMDEVTRNPEQNTLPPQGMPGQTPGMH